MSLIIHKIKQGEVGIGERKEVCRENISQLRLIIERTTGSVN